MWIQIYEQHTSKGRRPSLICYQLHSVISDLICCLICSSYTQFFFGFRQLVLCNLVAIVCVFPCCLTFSQHHTELLGIFSHSSVPWCYSSKCWEPSSVWFNIRNSLNQSNYFNSSNGQIMKNCLLRKRRKEPTALEIGL